MADVNEKLTENEKFLAIKSAEAAPNDDNKFKLNSKAALMQVCSRRGIINYETVL